MKNSLKVLLATATLTALALVLYAATGDDDAADGDTPPVDPSGMVRVIKPVPGGLERSCVQPATVQSWDIVNLFSEVTGILVQKPAVDINMHVKKDQVLAEIYAPDLDKDWQLANAEVERAKKKVVLAEKRLLTAHANKQATEKLVQKLAQQLLSAKANATFRTKRLARYDKLAKGGNIEVQAVDTEQDSYEDALAQKEELQASLE